MLMYQEHLLSETLQVETLAEGKGVLGSRESLQALGIYAGGKSWEDGILMTVLTP